MTWLLLRSPSCVFGGLTNKISVCGVEPNFLVAMNRRYSSRVRFKPQKLSPPAVSLRSGKSVSNDSPGKLIAGAASKGVGRPRGVMGGMNVPSRLGEGQALGSLESFPLPGEAIHPNSLDLIPPAESSSDLCPSSPPVAPLDLSPVLSGFESTDLELPPSPSDFDRFSLLSQVSSAAAFAAAQAIGSLVPQSPTGPSSSDPVPFVPTAPKPFTCSSSVFSEELKSSGSIGVCSSLAPVPSAQAPSREDVRPSQSALALAVATVSHNKELFLGPTVAEVLQPRPSIESDLSFPGLDPLYDSFLSIVRSRPLPVPDVDVLSAAERLAMQIASFEGSTLPAIPLSARQSLIDAVKPALRGVERALANNDDSALLAHLACFSLVPQFALLCPSGQIDSKKISQNLGLFVSGKFPVNPRPASAPRVPPQPPKEFLTPEQQSAVRRAVKLANANRMSRAVSALDSASEPSQGVLDPTPSNLARLAALHPPPSSSVLPSLPSSAPLGKLVSEATAKAALRKTANGSAADVFGWTGELLQSLSVDKDCKRILRRLAQAIRDGQVGSASRSLLLCSWLLGLDRGPDRNPRPLAGGSVLLKFACHCAMVENKAQVEAVVSEHGIALGLFAQDGPVVAARLTQLMLEADDKHIAILTDLLNAFNTVPRALLLEELFAHPTLSGLWRIMWWIYGSSSLLLVFKPDGSLALWLYSCEGVRQGCVFGTFGFTIATLRLLVKIKQDCPKVLIVAITDDVTLSGPQEEVLQAFSLFLDLCRSKGLTVQKKKCLLLAPVCDPLPALSSFVRLHGLILVEGCVGLLGTVIGRDDNAKSLWIENKVKSWEAPLKLANCSLVPAQMALLFSRWMASRPSYLARANSPELTSGSFQAYDSFVRAHFERKHSLSLTNSFSAAMLQLPIRLGGVGFARSGDPVHLAAAFVSSMAITARHIIKTPLRSLGTGTISQLPTGLALTISLNTLHSVHDWPNSGFLPANLVQFFAKFKKASPAATKGFQSGIDKTLQNAYFAGLLENGSPEQRALLNSRAIPSAGAWMRTTAFTSDTRLTDSEVKFGLSLATNQLPPNLPSHCFCGLPLTVEHTISCPSGRAKLHRHNRLVNLFVSFASFHGVSHELVPRLTYEDCKNSLVPDAKFFLPLTVVQVDVSVVSPLCPTNLPATARNGGTALLARELAKNVKYLEKANRQGDAFVPLVFETHGRPGADVRKFLRQLTSQAGLSLTLPVSDCLMKLQLELLRGNSYMASSCMMRSRHFHAREQGAKYQFLGE